LEIKIEIIMADGRLDCDVLAANPLFAQLGPKDPTGGSATELDRIKVGQAAPEFGLEKSKARSSTCPTFAARKPWY
jgi:hypothetical protein